MKKVLLTILVTVLVLAIAAGATFMLLDHDVEIFGVKISPPNSKNRVVEQEKPAIVEEEEATSVTEEIIATDVPASNEEAQEPVVVEETANNENLEVMVVETDDEEISIVDLTEEAEDDNMACLYTDRNGDVFLLTQRQADSGKYANYEGAATENKLHVKDGLFTSYKPAFCDNFDLTWVTVDTVDIIDEELYDFETYYEAFEATEIYDDECNVTHRRYDHQYDGVKVAVFTLRVEGNVAQKLALFYQEEFGYCFDVVGTPAPAVTSAPTEEPTPTPTKEPTPTPTKEPTPTPTKEPTPTPTKEPTPTPTNTPNPTLRPRESETPIPSNTPNPTLRPRNTETPIPSNTPNPTLRPRNTETPIPSSTPNPTLRPSETEDPVPSNTPNPTLRPRQGEMPSNTPIITAQPTETTANTPAPDVRDRQDESIGMGQIIGATLTVSEVDLELTIEDDNTEVQEQVETIAISMVEETQEPEPNPFVRER